MITSIEILNASKELSSEQIRQFEKGIKRVSVKKGTIIQRVGEPSVASYFVLKGLLKSYAIDQKGKEHVFMFASENGLSEILMHTPKIAQRNCSLK